MLALNSLSLPIFPRVTLTYPEFPRITLKFRHDRVGSNFLERRKQIEKAIRFLNDLPDFLKW